MKKIINLLTVFLLIHSLGQAQNPMMIKDIGEIPQKWVSSAPQKFAEVGGKIFFVADDGTDAGTEMWRTDGTDSGTELIGDLNNGTNSQGCQCSPPFVTPVDFGGKAFWLTNAYQDGYDLWRADTTGDAVKIGNFTREPFNSSSSQIKIFQGNLIFNIGGEIWKSNGNPNEAEMIFDADKDRLNAFKIIDNRIYFTRRITTGTGDQVEIWSTDGTTAGTTFYKKVVGDPPIQCGEYEVAILNFNGKVAYTLRPDFTCNQISWLFVEGFDPVMENHAPSYGMSIYSPVVQGDKIYYLSFKPIASGGNEHYLKVFENGTVRIIRAFSTSVRNLKLLPSGKMIFHTTDDLWVTDGTTNGTTLLNALPAGSFIEHILPYQNGYVFTAFKDGESSFWFTDGTNDETFKIGDYPVPSDFLLRLGIRLDSRDMLIANDKLYFGGNDGQRGLELWSLDLTAPGTVNPPQPNSPDLSVDEVQNPSTVNINEPTDIVFDLLNDGDEPVTGDITVGIYVSRDLDFTSDDILVGEVNVNGLAVDEVKTITTQFTLPANLEHLRLHRLLVYVDHNQLVTESDETNNLDYSNVTPFNPNAPKPDLQPEIRRIPTDGKTGDLFFVDVRVINGGLADSKTSTTGLYLSMDNSWSPDDRLLVENTSGYLDAGATSNQRSLRFIVPNLSPGDYFLISVVDNQNIIVESDETNNVAVNPFEILTPVDLQAEVAWIQTFNSLPNDVFVDYLIFNFGSQVAPFFRVGAYFSTDDTYSPDDVLLGEQFSFLPLTSGDSFDGQIQFTIPQNIVAGDYYILIYADDTEQVQESDETNNVFPISYTITTTPKIDLELSFDDLADPNPKRWTFFSPILTVTNNGTDVAENIEIHVPRPQDVIYSGGNEVVASQGSIKVYSSEIWRVGDLTPGESATLQLNYFRMEGDPFPVYAQVQSVDQTDDDSTPNNGSCCIANEDDEAALLVGLAPPTFVRRDGSGATANSVFEIQVSPNPFKNQFVAEVISEETASIELSIFDVAGKIIWRKPVELQKGYNSFSIDGSDLPSGVLMLTTSPAKPDWKPIRLVKMD